MNNKNENAGGRRIIGLVGYGTAHDGSFRSTAGVGKDTVADILIRDKGYVKAAFADPIKHAARFLFGLDKEEAWGRDKKEVPMADWGFSPRELMRRFGTEFARYRIGASVWLDVMSHRLSLPADRQFGGLVPGQGDLPGEKDFSSVLCRTMAAMFSEYPEHIADSRRTDVPLVFAATRDTIGAAAPQVAAELTDFAVQMVYDPSFETTPTGDAYKEALHKFLDIRNERPFYSFLAPNPEAGPAAGTGGYVVTDVRFPDEAALIENLGGTVVRVERNLEAAGMDIPPSPHASETALLPLLAQRDYPVIRNDGTPKMLSAAVDALLSSLPQYRTPEPEEAASPAP